MIGKNGYRYKALSYLLFSWIYPKYNLFVRLEIDKFLKNQQQMIKKHLKSFIERIKDVGYGSTQPLDGVLIHLGIEYLREIFPKKMIVIKNDKYGNRFIKVSDFKKK